MRSLEAVLPWVSAGWLSFHQLWDLNERLAFCWFYLSSELMHRPCYPSRAVLQDTNTWSQPAGVSGHCNRYASMVCCCARSVGRGKKAPTSTLLFSLNYSIPFTGTFVRSWPTLGVGELVEEGPAALRNSRLRRSEMAAAAGAGRSPQERVRRRRRRGALLTGGCRDGGAPNFLAEPCSCPENKRPALGAGWQRGAVRAGGASGRSGSLPAALGVGKPRGVLREAARAALEGQKKAQPSSKYGKHTSASGGSTLSPLSLQDKGNRVDAWLQYLVELPLFPLLVGIISGTAAHCNSSCLVRCHAACRGPTRVFVSSSVFLKTALCCCGGQTLQKG